MSRTKRAIYYTADRKLRADLSFICLCPGPVSHPAAHNVGPAQPAVHHGSHGGLPEPVHHNAVHHNAVHNSISSSPSVNSAPVVTEVHHGVHEGGHDGGYDEKPDPFHFEYGVHDDKYYTDFSEQRSGDEYGNIVGEYQVGAKQRQ